MSIESISEATRAGMAFERLRMEAASRNIAAANVPLAPTASATATQASAPGFEAQLSGASEAGLQQQAIGTRLVHDPSHPLADAQGMVHYPAIDLVQEMTTLMTASRGYEANVRAYNMLRNLSLRALEIGAK
jgi:flagellar basal-body rod protein FlgC